MTTAPSHMPSSPTPTAVSPTAPKHSTSDTWAETDVPKRGLIVASADVATPTGKVGFHVDVTATGEDTYAIRTTDFHSNPPGAAYEMFFRQYDESVGSCITDGVSFGYASWGGPNSTAQAVPPQVDLTQAGDDPSFLKNVVITTSPATLTSCLWQVVAVTPLTWHTPNRHPGLDPHDTGNRPGATGTVTATNGTLRTYTTAAGDTEAGLEKRFGITLRDLQYLNAASKPGSPFTLYAGQQLNLDPLAR
ncbi:LysM peptidoglycan-binding domain-containing protein [Frondihabitans cladoniiphilus]|uniref:LysM domain-containing protein n=1 Tax=Frondihabitans cladoniiphilus TaxID=715785 RepID=A0ABP8W7C1_9MICO